MIADLAEVRRALLRPLEPFRIQQFRCIEATFSRKGVVRWPKFDGTRLIGVIAVP